MSLLRDLQQDVIDSKGSLTIALRRAKVLAYNLKNKDLQSWVEYELAGYRDKETVPEYRRLLVLNRGDFMNSAWHFKGKEVPLSVLPEKLRGMMEEHISYQSVPQIESLLESSEQSFQIPWMAEMTNLLSYKVYDNLACVSAWQEVQRSQLVGVLEAVRDRLLTMALELGDQMPELKKDDWDERQSEKVQTIVHNTIYGSHNVVAAGGQVTQTVTLSVERGDMAALIEVLKELGLALEETEEFRKAIEEDGDRKKRDGFGSKVNQLIGNLVNRSLNWGSSASAGLVAQALAGYYGWT